MGLQGTRFSVVVTEGRPDEDGLRVARALEDLNIPVVAVLDAGAAYAMDALKSVFCIFRATTEPPAGLNTGIGKSRNP